MSKKSENAPKYAEYDESKLWFERKGSVLTIGLTTRCIEDVGEIQSIDFPDEGEDYSKGDVMITIEGSNGGVEVTAPATGVIEAINEDVRDATELISEDPMEGGWLLKLEVQDLSDLMEFDSDELDVGDLSDDDDLDDVGSPNEDDDPEEDEVDDEDCDDDFDEDYESGDDETEDSDDDQDSEESEDYPNESPDDDEEDEDSRSTKKRKPAPKAKKSKTKKRH